MIGTAHFQNVLLSCLQSGDAGCHHAGLRAGSQHAEHLYRRNTVRDLFCQFVLKFMEQAGGRSTGVQKVDDLSAYRFRIAAKDRRTAGLKKVVIPVAVTVIELCTFRLIDDDRKRVVECQVVLYASRNDLLCLTDQFLGFPAFLLEIIVHITLKCIPVNGIDRRFLQLIQLAGHFRRIQIFINGKSVVRHNKCLLVQNFVSHRSRLDLNVPSTIVPCQSLSGGKTRKM